MHLGYYIHGFDSGNVQRAKLISQNIKLPITFIGTNIARHDWSGIYNYRLLSLSEDTQSVSELPINENSQTYSFHYAPYYNNSSRQRILAIANWVERTNPTAVVVDSSVEIIQQLRLLGVPVIALRQHGSRSDFPHLCGYNAAYKLLALFPPILESSTTPKWAIDKSIYVSGFSRYSNRELTKQEARSRLEIASYQKVVVILNGKNKGKYCLSTIASAASASPEWLWLIVGQIRRDCNSLPDNISVLGWRDDTYVYLKAADVAISSGGHSTMMEIGTAKIPFMSIPDDKQFGEQRYEAELLEDLGLCLIGDIFPQGDFAKSTLNKLQKMNIDRWDRIMSADGALQAARKIESEVRLLDRYCTEFATMQFTPSA